MTPRGQATWADGGEHALVLDGINKWFGSNHVLTDVSFELGRGKVVALLGENGSGKSTIIKILSGFYDPAPGGRIEVGGNELTTPVSPARAHDAGLRFVHQDLGLVQSMSISDNVGFSTGFRTPLVGAIRRRRIRSLVRKRLERLGLRWDPDALVSSLSPAQRTMLAIARVLGDPDDRSPRMLVLDEPTATLPATEVGQVFDIVQRVTQDGGTVLYVSHRIDEVLEIADEVIVLRDGKIIAQRSTEGLTHEQIVALLLGRELARTAPRRADEETDRVEGEDDWILRLRGVSGRIVSGIDLDVRRGEILGIGGLAGCGRSELARLIAGAQKTTAGTMMLDGELYDPTGPGEAIRSGITYVPEDRRNLGCIGPFSVQQNLTLLDLRPFGSAFWLDKRKERREALALIEHYDIRPADPTRPIAKLSGGNQQKAVLAKSLRVQPRVIVLDEPTQGIDIGAKADIGRRVLELARAGTTVILASSDAPELVALCDRMIVLDRGRIRAEMDRSEISEDEIALTTTGAVTVVTTRTPHSGRKAEKP
ncbi:sugar ABC transporter ATP-binding protein [Microbacterium aoyamense]|uniref:Sugar ABC transporter ATP-binding protein n=1 Tax=Microbacterium aoyamense TaxID=344166 RepID=A0ABP5B4U3_9MICO|nr:sugar ABC transporter ATP-binding protein [Microbacterium aoyamense]